MDEGIPLEILKNHGVMYDGFSDRIVHPIYNMNGDIILDFIQILKAMTKQRTNLILQFGFIILQSLLMSFLSIWIWLPNFIVMTGIIMICKMIKISINF